MTYEHDEHIDEDNEYIAENCYVLSDSYEEMSLVCLDVISANLLVNRVQQMVRRNELPPLEIRTRLEEGTDGVERHIHLIPDMSPEDILDYIASDIGLE